MDWRARTQVFSHPDDPNLPAHEQCASLSATSDKATRNGGTTQKEISATAFTGTLSCPRLVPRLRQDVFEVASKWLAASFLIQSLWKIDLHRCGWKNLLGHCFSCSDAFVPDLSSDICAHVWFFRDQPFLFEQGGGWQFRSSPSLRVVDHILWFRPCAYFV